MNNLPCINGTGIEFKKIENNKGPNDVTWVAP